MYLYQLFHNYSFVASHVKELLPAVDDGSRIDGVFARLYKLIALHLLCRLLQTYTSDMPVVRPNLG